MKFTGRKISAGYAAGKTLVTSMGISFYGGVDPETGLAAVAIKLYTDPDGDGDPADGILLATTYTNGSGNYSFAGLPDGNYAIVETNPIGALSTADAVGANEDYRSWRLDRLFDLLV